MHSAGIVFSVIEWMGAPFLFAGVVYVYKKVNSVRKGILEILRSSLISSYNKHIDLGYAPIYEKEHFENIWVQYHNLGGNGIFEKMRQDFLDLPTR